MTNRTDDEYNKFDLEAWAVVLRVVEGQAPATALLLWDLDDLEAKKFNSEWQVRTITTF